MGLTIRIDDTPVEAAPGTTILVAAQEADLYIPSLCAHPNLPPQKGTPPAESIYHGAKQIAHAAAVEGETGCGLCVVQVNGMGQVPACATAVQPEMCVRSRGADLESLRRQRLARILARHPHVCLTCAQREGCTREPCSMNVAVEERCCELLGRCELQAVAEYIGIDAATPRYVPAAPDRMTSEPLFDRDPTLCIACGRCVRACNGREVYALGWVHDEHAQRWVGPLAPTPVEAGCRLCGSCVEVCPTGALADRGIRRAERDTALVPCRSACPAGTDVPRYVRLVAAGRFQDAAAVVAERAPLVETLGQICFHPCENACRRNDVNGAPISICKIKREAGAASATSWTQRLPEARADTQRSVAVVGAGPAGLVAAQRLRLLGHRVTLVEAEKTLGGMLAHAIPAFRLSRRVVVRETAALARGIQVRTGVRLIGEAVRGSERGNNVTTLSELRSQHDAVVLATGASKSVDLNVPGEGLPGVRHGLSFLADLAHGDLPPALYVGRRVVVVGGGNVAVDCARSARRLGASLVEMVCLEQPDEMPAYETELQLAKVEGIRILHGWGIAALCGNGSVSRVSAKRCTRVFDADRRFDPVYDESRRREIPADAVLLAVGQQPDGSILPGPLEGVFLAGDLRTGAGSVVDAIASGRDMALEVDRYLGGTGALELKLGPVCAPAVLGRVDDFASLPRLEPAPLPTTLDFETLQPGLGLGRARLEADRCLRCDLRLHYHTPMRPPARVSRLPLQEDSLQHVPAADGVVRFFGADGDIVEIIGGADMRHEVSARLGAERATHFDFEPCPMYTQRQNELLSQYMETHGRMPPGVSAEDDLDDLF